MAYHITKFRAVIARRNHASDPEIKLALSKIADEAKARVADSSALEFFESLSQCLQQLKGFGNASLRIGCLLECANYFYGVGDVLQGIAVCQEAVRLARHVQDLSQFRKSQTALGILLADSGALTQAIEAHTEAIDVAQRIRDYDGHAIGVLNLGVALLYAGQLDDALACIRLAENLVNALQTRDIYLPRLYANEAACYLRMGKINEGVEAAKRSVCDSKPSNNHLSRFVREFNYIQLLLEQGTRSLAIERAEVVRGLAASTTSPRAIVLSKLSQGMVEVFHGTASAGLDLLDQAADDSRADYVLYQDALAALIKAHEELGNYEQALQHLQQLLNFVKEKRARFAIWHLEVGSKLVRVKMPMPSDVEKLDNKHVALRAKVAESRLAQCQIEMLERLAVPTDLREERSGDQG